MIPSNGFECLLCGDAGRSRETYFGVRRSFSAFFAHGFAERLFFSFLNFGTTVTVTSWRYTPAALPSPAYRSMPEQRPADVPMKVTIQRLGGDGPLSQEIESCFRFLCSACEVLRAIVNPRNNPTHCFCCEGKWNTSTCCRLSVVISFHSSTFCTDGFYGKVLRLE